MSEKMILIDGNSLLHRAFHAIPLLETKSGLTTNAVYGFLTMLFRLLEEEKPDYLIIAFDKGKSTFRHRMYDGYKATRKPSLPELQEQFKTIREAMEAMGLSYVEMDEYEADDILGAYAKNASRKGINSLIVTGDKDALQLIDEHISVLYTKRGISLTERCDEAFIRDKYNLRPKQLIDVKALMGDPSDNIPGVPGVGEKTALKLIQSYNSLDGVYEHLTDIAGKKLLENLQLYQEQARLSYKLGRINTHIDDLVDLSTYRFQGIKEKTSADLFRRLEFTSLLKKINVLPTDDAGTSSVEKKSRKSYPVKQFDDLTAWEEYVAALDTGRVAIYLDFERNLQECNIHKVSLFDGETVGEFVPFMATPKQAKTFLEVAMKRKDLVVISAQAKALVTLCKQYKIDCSQVEDLSIMAHLLEAEQRDVSGSEIIAMYVEENLAKEESEVLSIGSYLAYDILLQKLDSEGLLSLYRDVELPLLYVLCDMEIHGVRVDMDYLETMKAQLQEMIQGLEQEIFQLAGENFNINSPKQLAVVLFESLKLTTLKKTKTGYSTDAEVLEKISHEHPIVPLILEYRKWVKLQSTYVEGLLDLGRRENGVIHTTYNQTVTATGRLSSTDPNLQNIPIRSEESKLIRRAFMSVYPGNILLAADYSQIELRVLAHLSQDKKMIDAYLHDEDIHTATASEVFDVPKDMVNAALRRKAKAVNFGIVYGISDYGLSRDLNIPVPEAKAYIETYFNRYPGVKSFIDSTIREARDTGEVRTILNRKRRIRNIKSSNYNARSAAERMAMNTPVQGSAADIIKLAMIKVKKMIEERGLQAQMILQVHDEIIIELPREELDEVVLLLQECMTGAITLDVPLEVDCKVGSTWYDMEEI